MSSPDNPQGGRLGPASAPGSGAPAPAESLDPLLLLAALPDLVLVVSRDFACRDANRAYLDAYLKKREEVLGRPLAELLGQGLFERSYRPRLERCFGGETAQDQLWIELPQGGFRFLSLRFSPYAEADGSVSGAVVSARDITEVRRAEDALAESETRYRTMVEASLDDIFVIDRSRRVRYVNAPAARRFGGPAEALLGQSMEGLFPPPVVARLMASVTEVFATGSPLYRESPVAFPGGKAWLGTWLIPFLRGPQGEIETVMGISRDVTERRTMEDALRESEERFRSLVENLGDWVWEVDARGIFTYCSPTSRDLLGLTPEQLLGHLAFEVMPEAEVPRVREALRPLVREGKPFAVLEHLVRGPGGPPITVERSGVPIQGQGRLKGYRGISRNVSERKLVEAELRQAQKLEALGRLAGGVAHDFNNLLNVIMGYAALLTRWLPPGSEGLGQLEQIQKAADQAAGLTRQLLAFGRRQSQRAEILDLNVLVSDQERMLRRLGGEDVKLEISLAPDLAAVKADRGQLERVVLNLVANARDAMPGGGRLDIETRNAVGASGEPVVVLAVTDSGQGMDAETQSRLFEPFFTTKAGGTGLGLSTVFGIVRRAGGQIRVRSRPGSGSSFEVWMPAAAERPTPGSAAPVERPMPTGQETVLVAEDQDMVRTLLREVLSLLGYQVLVAGSGREALELAAVHPGPIHLLLSDVVMPGLSGPETALQLASMRPDTRVLFMSAYTDERIAGYGVLDNEAPLLEKPFTSETLARSVREALSRPTRHLRST